MVGGLIRRIVYAEGDVINISSKAVLQLKTELKMIVDLLVSSKPSNVIDGEELRDLDMGLMCYAFKEQISRFIRTTKLTKRYGEGKEDDTSVQGEEDDFGIIEDEDKDDIDADEFAQNNMEGLSDFVGSDKDPEEDTTIKVKATQASKQSNQHVKSVLQELEQESGTDEESLDSLLSNDEGERRVSNRAGIDKER